MTVAFSTETAAGPTLDVDSLLRPQLSATARSAGGPDSPVLRVLCRGLAAGLTPAAVRAWLLRIDDPDIASSLSNPYRFHRLVRSARAAVASAASPAGRAAEKFSVARVLVARETTPVAGLSWAREVNARIAFAIICGIALDTGYRKVLCTAGYLAVEMGVSRAHAAGVLLTLEKTLGWIRRDGKRGAAIRWRIVRLAGEEAEELQERAWLFGSAIDAIVSGSLAEDNLATVLRSAAHPAWHYSTPEPGLDGKKVRRVLGAKAWVALVHQFAGLPVESGLGLVPRTLRKAKRELEADLPGCLAGSGDLASDLDVIAVTSGADARREAREEDAKKQAAIDSAQLNAFRAARTARFEARKAAFRILKAGSIAGGPGAIPSSGDRDELAAWVNVAAGFWRGASGSRLYASGGVAGLVEVLAEKIREHSYSVEDAAKAADFVFRG